MVNGNSELKSDLALEEPEMLYLSLNRGVSKSMDNIIPFFAEPGTMTIETTLKEFYAKAKITGSKNNDLYNDYKKIKERFSDEQNKTLSFTLLAKKTNSIEKLDSLAQRADKLKMRSYLDAINFAVNNGKHEVAPYIALTEIYDTNIKYWTPFTNRCRRKLQNPNTEKCLRNTLPSANRKNNLSNKTKKHLKKVLF